MSVTLLRLKSTKKLLMGLLVVSVLVTLAVISGNLDLVSPFSGRAPREVRRQDEIWTWSCESNQCLRRQWPATASTSTPSMSLPWLSLPHCRSTCGIDGPPLWPRPTGLTHFGRRTSVFNLQHVVYKIDRGVDTINKLLLRDAFHIFKSNLEALVPEDNLDVTLRTSDVILKVTVFLRGDSETYLSLNTSESYHLRIDMISDNVLNAGIAARTFFGARNALETLSQLIWWETDENSLGAFRILREVTIDDAPRFSYRGVMIDVARNFMPLSALKSTIVGMAASKLNTLHLHLTDSQSFPFESSTYPQMSRRGAYSRDKVYTAADIRTLTEFARVRGVRILPEIDAPSHSAAGWAWGEEEGMGKLAVCVDRQPWRDYCGEPPCGQLNPSNDNTYLVLGGLYKDLVDSTSVTDMFHVGGDEVNMLCWADEVHNSTKHFTREVFYEMLTNFHRRAFAELQQVRAIENVIVWSSRMSNDEYNQTFPSDKYIIEEWGSSTWADTTEHLRLKYRVILAHVNAWYLDCGFGNWIPGADEACGPVSTWQRVYYHRPWVAYKPEEIAQVLGGEVCLWSEVVDGLSVELRVWPRAAALAERLWTDTEIGEVREVTTRMAVHRERLVTRGVKASVIWPRWCDENPNEC